MAKLTKAKANKRMREALAKAKKVWMNGGDNYWFPTSSFVTIEKEILKVVSRNK